MVDKTEYIVGQHALCICRSAVAQSHLPQMPHGKDREATGDRDNTIAPGFGSGISPRPHNCQQAGILSQFIDHDGAMV